MIVKEELIKLIKNKNIYAIELYDINSKFESNSFQMKNNDINELLEIAIINEVNNIFYTYGYYDIDNYYISEEDIDDIEPNILRKIKKDINKHNKQVEKEDFSKPAYLTIFCKFDGSYFFIEYEDDWTDKINILSKYEMIEMLTN